MKYAAVSVVFTAMTLVSTAAMADITLQSGTEVGIFARDCSVSPGCTSSGETNGPLPPLVEGAGGATAATSASIFTSTDPTDFPEFGLVSSTAGQQSFVTAGDTGSFDAPVIDAALYTQDSRVTVGGAALQAYTWDGTGPAARTISGSMTLSETGGWPTDGGSTSGVGMVVFTTGTDTADFTCGDISFVNAGLCVKNATVLSQNVVTTAAALSNQTIDLNLPSFQLTSPGETIFVLANTELFGNQGGYAADPFVTTISNETGLRPAAAPEFDPTSAFGGLTLLAGCLLVLRSRRISRRAC